MNNNIVIMLIFTDTCSHVIKCNTQTPNHEFFTRIFLSPREATLFHHLYEEIKVFQK